MIKCRYTGEYCNWRNNEPIFKIGTIESCDSEATNDLNNGKNYYASRHYIYHFEKVDGEWCYEIYHKFKRPYAKSHRYHQIKKEYADELIREDC